MTCIVALEHTGAVTVGGDSFLGNDDMRDLIDRPKFFRKDKLLIAYAGDLRAAQVLEHSLTLRKHRKNEKEMTYLVNYAIVELRKALEAVGALNKEDDISTQFLIALGGHIYILQEDFSIIRSKYGFSAIGAGQKYAYGAMHAMQGAAYTPEQKVEKALTAAAAFSPHVAAPFHILTV